MANKIAHYLITVVIAVAAALAVTSFQQPPLNEPVANNRNDQAAFDRVLKTDTLRCAYIVLPPVFVKDPNTGKLSGISYDIIEEMAKSLRLKVDWVEEVNFANLAEGFKTQRYDAVCFAMYLGNVSMARVLDFTNPVYYTGTGVFVRSDDHRFDNNLAAINSPDITVATMDAEMSQFIRLKDYPKTKDYSLPQTAGITEVLEAVENGKADVTFFDQHNTLPAMAEKLRDIAANNPIRLHAFSFAVDKGQTKLLSMFNMALRELELSGRINEILDQHEANHGSILRLATPYAPAKKR